MLDVASGPDLLRLIAIPFFGYVAWLDVRTRRVSNRTWIPLAALAIALLAWDLYRISTGDLSAFEQREVYIQTFISIGFVVPLSYFFWRIGGFGGADAKAFFVIALLFPTFPTYELAQWGLDQATLGPLIDTLPAATYTGEFPVVEPTLGVFSVTILSNTVIMGALYPVALAVKNGVRGYVSPAMFLAKPVQWSAVTEEYGTLLRMPDRRTWEGSSLAGLRSYLSLRGLDLDALRMYLQWRGLDLEDLREHPDRYRDPDSLPENPNSPGDGSIPFGEGGENRLDGDSVEEPPGNDTLDERSQGPSGEAPVADASPHTPDATGDAGDDDSWGAEAFLDSIEGSAYGTSPEKLREGLDALVSEDTVWISPGIPFLVPLFVGLLVAFTYGDILFAILDALGLAA